MDISELTLEYLMNKQQYEKYLLQKIPQTKSKNKKDKKFYRRRIFNLTKQLLNNDKPANLTGDVKLAFDNYVFSCVNFFKVLDKTDIIQEDYNNIEDDMEMKMDIDIDVDVDDENEINIDNIKNSEDANKLLMRSIKITHPTLLDNFVTIKSLKSVSKPIIPKTKDINLKDPALRNKGICKKKNITNIYDNISNEKNEIQKKNEKNEKNEIN